MIRKLLKIVSVSFRRKKIFKIFVIFILSLPCLFWGCGKNKTTVKVAATSVPHAEMLAVAKEDLKGKGITLEIIQIDDYNLPNRALADGEIDANFFQHTPFLEEQISTFHYPITCLVKVHVEPMGIYSKKIHSLAALKDNSIVAIPQDPTNEQRALLLLEKEGLIKLEKKKGIYITVLDIKENPKHLQFKEVDAAVLPRSLKDVDIAAIPMNFALQSRLFSQENTLAVEDQNSFYANVIAVRKGDETRPEIIALKEEMNSEKMAIFIWDKYQGAVLPAFGPCSP